MEAREATVRFKIHDKATKTPLSVCVLAFTAAHAQNEAPHNHAQTAGKKIRKSKAKAQQTYSCPMHPEVTSKSRGKCPKCKMELRPVDQKEAMAETAEMTNVSSSDQTPKMHIPDLGAVGPERDGKIHFLLPTS